MPRHTHRVKGRFAKLAPPASVPTVPAPTPLPTRRRPKGGAHALPAPPSWRRAMAVLSLTFFAFGALAGALLTLANNPTPAAADLWAPLPFTCKP